MPLQIRKSVQQMVLEASKEIETLTIGQARALLGRPGVTFIDLRDPRELWREGGIPGAINVPRGMLEFWIDPASPYHKSFFASGDRFVLFCGGGWRSALAAKVAQDMGLLKNPVRDMKQLNDAFATLGLDAGQARSLLGSTSDYLTKQGGESARSLLVRTLN